MRIWIAFAHRIKGRDPVPIHVRVSLLELPRNGHRLGLRLLDRDAGLEPPDDTQPARHAAREQVRIHFARIPGAGRPHQRLHHHRDIDITRPARLDPIEASGGHADDGEAPAVERELFSDHVRIAAETPLPQAVADDGDRVCARRPVLVRQEGTAKRGADAEQIKVVARDNQTADEFRSVLHI